MYENYVAERGRERTEESPVLPPSGKMDRLRAGERSDLFPNSLSRCLAILSCSFLPGQISDAPVLPLKWRRMSPRTSKVSPAPAPTGHKIQLIFHSQSLGGQTLIANWPKRDPARQGQILVSPT